MNRGFSLIEMVITLSILGVVTAIAVPRYSDASDGYKLSSSENQILSTLDAWRARAHSSSTMHTIYIDASAETIYLFKGPVKDISLAVDQLDLGSEPFKINIHRTNLSSPTNELIISGYGLYERSAIIRLVKGSMMLDITIDGGTLSTVETVRETPKALLDTVLDTPEELVEAADAAAKGLDLSALKLVP